MFSFSRLLIFCVSDSFSLLNSFNLVSCPTMQLFDSASSFCAFSNNTFVLECLFSFSSNSLLSVVFLLSRSCIFCSSDSFSSLSFSSTSNLVSCSVTQFLNSVSSFCAFSNGTSFFLVFVFSNSPLSVVFSFFRFFISCLSDSFSSLSFSSVSSLAPCPVI